MPDNKGAGSSLWEFLQIKNIQKKPDIDNLLVIFKNFFFHEGLQSLLLFVKKVSALILKLPR